MARFYRSKPKPYLLFSTAVSRKEAQKIAQVLVHKRLAACVNIIPNIVSVYRWQGKTERAKEYLLVMKTEARKLKRLKQALIQNHSYSVPELIGWPIAWGHEPYLKWLSEAVIVDDSENVKS